MPAWAPKRGDAVFMHFDPQSGKEQAGHRPALVLSPQKYNRIVGLAVVCPITSQSKSRAFEVDIPAGLQVSGVILADHAKSLDWRERKAYYACTMPDEVLEAVIVKLSSLFDPNTPA